jgi:hypothetical protein
VVTAPEVIQIAGLGVLVAGLALWSVPLGVMLAGLCIVLVGLALSR